MLSTIVNCCYKSRRKGKQPNRKQWPKDINRHFREEKHIKPIIILNNVSTKVCCHQSNANMSPQSGVQQKDLIQVSSLPTGEMQPLEESKSVLHQDKGEAAYTEKVPNLVPDWSIFMQMMNPNLHNLIGPHSIVLIDWNCVP